MYIILIQLKRSDEQIIFYKEEHKEYLKEQIEKGYFLCSGNRTPHTGEVILSCIQDIETLHCVLNEDPFYKNRIGQYEIIEFEADMKCEKLVDFLEEQEKKC